MEIEELYNKINDNHGIVMGRLDTQDNTLKELKDDIQGNDKRNIEGIIPTLKRHGRLLWPQEIIFKIPKSAWIFLLAICEISLEANKIGIVTLLMRFITIVNH